MGGSRIRIAFVIDTIFEPTGGSETQLLALLNHVDPTRFDPHLFCLRSSHWLDAEAKPLAWTNLDIVVTLRPSLLRDVAAFARCLREGEFKIVQTHFRDANLIGVLAAAQAKVPSIISTRRGVPYWRSRVELALLRQLNRLPTAFVTNSQATKQRFVTAERIAPDQIHVIYNAVDQSRFTTIDESEKETLRCECGIQSVGARVVGLVSNLRAVKGIDTFLRAAAVVLDRHPSTRFIVVGQGPEEARLRRLMSHLHLDNNVRILGVRRDVPRLLQICDIGVLASHFESFSNAILEYLAAGLPVVVTDVGGAREVVRPGENGFIVPPGSAESMAERLIQLLNQEGGPRSWLKNNGLDERFTLETMVHSHEALYERQLESGRR